MIYDSILDTIGRTPVVRLHRIAPKHVTLYAKVESFNPGGSVKDRLAIAIILDAEAKGLLKPGDTVVEATSGNTGVALAMVCAARGYKFVATMAETFSIERRKLMRAYGAKVILTPAAERGSGMVRRAEELAKQHGWFLARQFTNPANPAYHRQTTAAEILRDFAGERLDHFVTGWGTGGTLTGVGEVLQGRASGSAHHHVRTGRRGAAVGQGMVAAQDPGLDAGLRARGAQPRGRRRDPADRRVVARDTARRLAQEEGLFVGISAGGTVAARAGSREDREGRRRDPGDAARHRRALPRRSCSRASTKAPTTSGWRWRSPRSGPRPSGANAPTTVHRPDDAYDPWRTEACPT